MYALPQVGILANKLLHEPAPYGFYEAKHTPGLWRHKTLPIKFALVVDDFGVEYIGKTAADFLVNALKNRYKISTDWNGTLYCGITLEWNYQKHYVDASMPLYLPKKSTEV